jgi:uncharacterized protein (DUF305 family)
MKNINKFLIIFLVVIILFTFLNNRQDPCSEKLTDYEYLQHMIPHHQVAIDISKILQKKSTWPEMQNILRKLIWIQNYEINMMRDVLNNYNLPKNDMSQDDKKMDKNYYKILSDVTFPNKIGLTKTYCDPNFFDPDAHMKHIKNMELNDDMYIKHMIPHHKVAVDMSKKLLKNTTNDFMIFLAYRIIRSQQEEIILLNDLLNKKNYKNKSGLIY